MPALLENQEEIEADSDDDGSFDNSESSCKEQEESVHPKDRPDKTDVDKKVGLLSSSRDILKIVMFKGGNAMRFSPLTGMSSLLLKVLFTQLRCLSLSMSCKTDAHQCLQ